MPGLKAFARAVLPGAVDQLLVRAIDQARLAREKPLGADYRKLGQSRDISLKAIFGNTAYAAEWRAIADRLFDMVPNGTRPGGGDGAAIKLKFPAGSCNPGDRQAIYNLVRELKPVSILEVGTFIGSSTVSMAAALEKNRSEGEPAGFIHSVDIIDVNEAGAPWQSKNMYAPPRDLVAEFGVRAQFTAGDASDFLRTTTERFDLIFLDGSHQAPHVYREVQLAQRVLNQGGTILLHDFFPSGRALWDGSPPLPGPWLAIERLRREGAPVEVVPFGALPWPTKAGSDVTSLALLARS